MVYSTKYWNTGNILHFLFKKLLYFFKQLQFLSYMSFFCFNKKSTLEYNFKVILKSPVYYQYIVGHDISATYLTLVSAMQFSLGKT